MKQLFRQIIGHMLDQYVTVLTILAVVSSVTYLVLVYDLKGQEGNTTLVRLAAQQGQIVHQLNFLTSQLVHTEDINAIRDIRSEIIKKVTHFEDMHLSLKQGDRFVREGLMLVHVAGTLSPDLRTLYYEKPTQLNRLARKYISAVKGVLGMSHDELNQNRQVLKRLHSEISEPLVAGLDQAVTLYHKESEYMLSQTQNLQTVMFAATLISLVVVGTFLLRPLVLKLKESMLRVQEEKEFTDNVINTAQALIIGLDPAGKIVLFNQQAQENTGWYEEEVKGGEFFERFIPGDDRERLQNLYNGMIQGSVEFAGEMETRLMIRSGEQLNIVWHTTVVKDPQSNQPALFLATGLDITGRKLAEQNLQNAHKELEQLSARLQEEINLAATLQNAILPDPKIDLPGIVGEAALLTSSEVGGDYYDYYKVGGFRSVLLVGDVSGHGVAAGTMVSAAKAGVYPLIHEGVSSPGEILQSLNQTMLATAHQSLLMTMACLSLDARTGKLVFANAGHVLPYLWRRENRQWQMLEASGLPLGKSTEVDYKGGSVEIQLEVGDRLFLFTDGVVEEESPLGEPFGYDRLERVLDQFGEAEPDVLRDEVMSALRLHCGGAAFTDDVTIVVVNHSDRVIQAAGEESEAGDIVRLSEAFYRHGEHPVPRVSRQFVVFTAENEFADLLSRFSEDGICRVLPRNDALCRQIGWNRLLNQHHQSPDDDLYALIPESPMQRGFQLTHTEDKLFIMEEIQAWLSEQGQVSGDHLDSLMVLLDEMIENSLYAAPRDGQDNPYFVKGVARELSANEEVRIDIALSDDRLGLMVTDNWGTLTPAMFLKHVTHTMEQGIEAGTGGAGLYMMWRLSHYLQMRVYPHHRTQVTALWDLNRSLNIDLKSGFQFLYHSEYNAANQMRA